MAAAPPPVAGSNFYIGSYKTLHPAKGLTQIHDHVRDNDLTKPQWLGLRGAVLALLIDDTDNVALRQNFSADVDMLGDDVSQPEKVALQNHLMLMANAESYPTVVEWRTGRALLGVFEEGKALEAFDATASTKLRTAALFITGSEIFDDARIAHANALIQELNDDSEGQNGRIQTALDVMNIDYTKSAMDQLWQKGWNYWTGQ